MDNDMCLYVSKFGSKFEKNSKILKEKYRNMYLKDAI